MKNLKINPYDLLQECLKDGLLPQKRPGVPECDKNCLAVSLSNKIQFPDLVARIQFSLCKARRRLTLMLFFSEGS